MINPWFWAIGALIAAVAEILVPGIYLIWLAAGAAITALASFAFNLATTSQLLIFAAASVASCVAGYFAYRKQAKPVAGSPSLNQRGLELVGANGTVFEALRNGHGKIELGDSVWLAEGPDLGVGTPVVATALRDTILIVAPR